VKPNKPSNCMDAGGRAPTVGALGDAGAIAERGIKTNPYSYFTNREIQSLPPRHFKLSTFA